MFTICRREPESRLLKASRFRRDNCSLISPEPPAERRTSPAVCRRVTEVFEARKPKDPAAMAEISRHESSCEAINVRAK